MHFCRKIILLICLCMSTGSCGALAVALVTMPTYTDPKLGTADDSEVAILKHRLWGCFWCINEIKDADGRNIPIESSEQHPLAKEGFMMRFEKHRLSPGEYEISYSYRERHASQAYGHSRVVLKAGHVYAVREETCTTFCFRMDSNTSDIWLEDITTGEWIGGCRQGMGCVLNGQIKPYPHFTPPSPLMD